MKDKEIIFETDRSVEFIMSLYRIGHDERIKGLANEFNIDLYEEINDYVNDVLSSFEEKHKKILDKYFSNNLGIGLAILSKGQSINEFISDIKKLSNIELAYYMLITWGEIDFTISELADVVNENRIFNWIEENFAVSSDDKWQIMRVLNCPEEVKEELTEFLTCYYLNFYKDKEEEIDNFLQEYIRKNKKELIDSFEFSLDDILSSESKEKYIETNVELGALITYFLDFGQAFAAGANYIALGFRYPLLVKKISSKGQNIINYTSFFKVLSDETRLQVLMEINEGPKYLAQLAEIMDSSNPAISYHISKLFNIGLIEIESSDNRTYYQVKKDAIAEVIEVLENVFLN
ncbi:ArsR/SmtB family transcription factor [Natronospora cellulosivora (SeqCode)]